MTRCAFLLTIHRMKSGKKPFGFVKTNAVATTKIAQQIDLASAVTPNRRKASRQTLAPIPAAVFCSGGYERAARRELVISGQCSRQEAKPPGHVTKITLPQ
jgi:hypothetical protein